ncbi:hypothetical protein [Thermocatellispora tengchongensis]|uniref:hypothetical protein n=1 Tax=Thermocatellispora tengchongensis TaxID=1073253 RepID=UPI00363A7150
MPVSVSRCEFAGTPLAARDGREFVAKTLAGHPRIDDLVQITSELIANAVRHSHSSVRADGWR